MLIGSAGLTLLWASAAVKAEALKLMLKRGFPSIADWWRQCFFNLQQPSLVNSIRVYDTNFVIISFLGQYGPKAF